MGATTGHGGGATYDVGRVLRGWGGVVSVLLGIGVAAASWPLVSDFIPFLHRTFEAWGMTSDAATMALYWLGMISIGAGFLIAFNGPEARMNQLRTGTGGWSTLLLEVLASACVAALWLGAAATWGHYEDVFNTYEAGTELPAVGVMVLMIAGAVLLRWVRHRRSSESQ